MAQADIHVPDQFSQGALRAYLISFAIAFVVSLIAVIVINPATASQPDLRQVIYRYVEQVRAGNGLIFNAGERVLLVPSPAYMLVLAGLATLLSPLSVSVFTASQILFALSLALGAASLLGLATYAQLSRFTGITVAVIYCLAWSLWDGIGTAFPFASGLCLLSTLVVLRQQWRSAGIIAAIAVLCTPEAAIFSLVLIAYAANINSAGRFVASFGIILIAATVVLRLYYGPRWVDGLFILRDNATSNSLVDGTTLIIAVVLSALAIWALIKRGRADSVVGLLGTWLIVHIAIFAVLLRVGVVWHYSLIAGPLALLALIGLRELPVIRFRYGFELGSAALAVATTVITVLHLTSATEKPSQLAIAQDVKTIGFGSTSLALATAVPITQSVIALDGQLQPDLRSLLERGDTQSMLIRFAPDIVMLNASRIQPRDLTAGSLGILNYQSLDTTQFQRHSRIDSFRDYAVQAVFGTDIELVGAALDHPTLAPGDVLRVRLDWQVARPASLPVDIDLRLRSDEFLLAHVQDSYEPRLFGSGTWSTYHLLSVLDSAWSGPVVLEAAVIVSDGTIARIPITTINIK
jgi:hypothetical protein